MNYGFSYPPVVIVPKHAHPRVEGIGVIGRLIQKELDLLFLELHDVAQDPRRESGDDVPGGHEPLKKHVVLGVSETEVPRDPLPERVEGEPPEKHGFSRPSFSVNAHGRIQGDLRLDPRYELPDLNRDDPPFLVHSFLFPSLPFFMSLLMSSLTLSLILQSPNREVGCRSLTVFLWLFWVGVFGC